MDRLITPSEIPELADREAPGEVGPAKAAIGPAPRPSRRRGFGGTIVRVALLAGLIWLTYWNATTSRALDEAIDAEAKGDFPTALKVAFEHLDRRPWSAEATRIVARCLSRLDFAEEAESYYRRAWGLTVSDLRYRAYGLTRANLRERALQAYGDVLRRQPDDVAALRLKAGLLLSMTRWNDVIEIGRQLAAYPEGPIEVDAPVASAGHWTLKPMEIVSVPVLGVTFQGLAHHDQGNVEEAVAAYDQVLALDPDFRTMPLDRDLFWSQFGRDLLSIGRASDLIGYLKHADEGQNNPRLVAMVAQAQMQMGSMDEAEVSWRKVIELAPDHPAAWLNLGRIELGQGHPDEAARLLIRATSLAPDSVDAAYNLGLTYRSLGQANEARKWEQEAARLRHRHEEKTRVTSTVQSSVLPAP